jgi:hypothetical protein
MGAPLLNLLSPGFFIKEKMWSQSLVIYLDISVSRIHQTFHVIGGKNSACAYDAWMSHPILK